MEGNANSNWNWNWGNTDWMTINNNEIGQIWNFPKCAVHYTYHKYCMRIRFVYCLLLSLLLSLIIICLKCLYYFCLCRKAQEQVNHLSEISFFFFPGAPLLLLWAETSERQIVHNVGLWAGGVNEWMYVHHYKKAGHCRCCCCSCIKITKIIT